MTMLTGAIRDWTNAPKTNKIRVSRAQRAKYQLPRENEEWYVKYCTGENPFMTLHRAPFFYG